MDKRILAAGFRERFKELVDAEKNGLSGFLNEVGMDRSALSQFLDSKHDRLPRAETLRRIAEARGVSLDWLLCLENAPEGRQALTTSSQIESASLKDGTSPLDTWQAEAEGHKLRYVPATLPDMLDISKSSLPKKPDIHVGRVGAESVLSGLDLHDRDIEIAMPIHVVQDLSMQTGIWRDTPASVCKEQLEYMSHICKDCYPALRVHLFDGSKTFSAPFTVFGKLRAAIYIGDAYLVITAADQVKSLVKRFDHLVRQAIMSPDIVHETFTQLADRVEV